MKRYPAYKQEHRLPGIQEVPEHWGVVRNSLIFKEVSETGYGHLELLSILSDKGIVKQSETGRKERAPEDRSSYKRIQKGDIGYNLMNAFMGSIGASNYEGIISPAYAVCRPKIQIDPNYFHYLFRTDLYLTEFDRNAYGIMYERNRLYFDNFKKIYVPLPSLDEQKAIAHFIDRKLEEIDHFIRNKQRLIELLNEQKTVILNRAVTKGINPHAPMKNSGIEWLGEIPAHWEVRRLKYLISEKLKYGANEEAILDDRSLPRYIRITDFNIDGHLKEDTFRSLPYEVAKDYLLLDGDILFARSGATVGKTFHFKGYQGLACFAGYLIKAVPQKSIISSDFLYLFTKSSAYESWKDAIFIQATIQNIGADRYSCLTLPLPPYQEQEEIINYVKQECSNINIEIAKAEREIELIQEYRTTLISDAVTGKIDVRQNAALETTLTA